VEEIANVSGVFGGETGADIARDVLISRHYSAGS
jgi:hypothetical protein